MIYLIQDCYKNDKGEYIDILKIGYSDKPFMESRNNQYRTHNFGYRLLGEREGDTKLESFLHEKYRSLRLFENTEWFLYDESIVNEFFTIKEEDVDIVLTKTQYISNIQYYILQNITKPKDLYNKYKETIINELEKKNRIDIDNELSIICERIKDTFSIGYDITMNSIKRDCNIDNPIFNDIPDLITSAWLDKNPWKRYAKFYFDITIKEIIGGEFQDYIQKKIYETNNLLKAFEESRQIIAEVFQREERACRYKYNFVSVIESTGSDLKPVFNKLVMISEKKAFDIQRVDYADRMRELVKE